jgi:hypothetical protein
MDCNLALPPETSPPPSAPASPGAGAARPPPALLSTPPAAGRPRVPPLNLRLATAAGAAAAAAAGEAADTPPATPPAAAGRGGRSLAGSRSRASSFSSTALLQQADAIFAACNFEADRHSAESQVGQDRSSKLLASTARHCSACGRCRRAARGRRRHALMQRVQRVVVLQHTTRSRLVLAERSLRLGCSWCVGGAAQVNIDRALMRFEWLEALVRLAAARHVRAGVRAGEAPWHAPQAHARAAA